MAGGQLAQGIVTEPRVRGGDRGKKRSEDDENGLGPRVSCSNASLFYVLTWLGHGAQFLVKHSARCCYEGIFLLVHFI